MQYCGLELGHPIAHVSTSVCGLLVTVLTATEDVSFTFLKLLALNFTQAACGRFF
jgi:hypothetical protein